MDHWVFGGVDTTTKRAFLRIVPDRTRATLIPIITEMVVQGTTVWSDTWAPYFTLNQEGYNHSMVNHSKEFVAPNGVHTQEIESFWGQLKAELKIRRGFNKNQVQGFLDEFMYRREFKDRVIFDMLLEHINQIYHVNDY